MANYNYNFQGFDSKSMVRAVGRSLPISHKTSREIANYIKGMKLDKAISYLEQVMDAKRAVPYVRFKRDQAHRPGKMAAGGYPRKASENIIRILKSLKSNAESNSLSTEDLVLIHAISQPGPNVYRYGRKMGQHRKISHFEVVAQEISSKKKKVEKKPTEKPKVEKKPEPKKEEKPAVKKEEKPKAEKKPAPKETVAKKAPASKEAKK